MCVILSLTWCSKRQAAVQVVEGKDADVVDVESISRKAASGESGHST